VRETQEKIVTRLEWERVEAIAEAVMVDAIDAAEKIRRRFRSYTFSRNKRTYGIRAIARQAATGA